MDGLKPGRIVYYVFDEQSAAEVNRRRTNAHSIAERMKVELQHLSFVPDQQIFGWPAGAQAHIGNEVKAGDIYPAMVIRVWGSSGCSNLKVFLDGSDDYWVTSANFDAGRDPENAANVSADEKVYQPRTWHWMFDGQQTRYDPTAVKP